MKKPYEKPMANIEFLSAKEDMMESAGLTAEEDIVLDEEDIILE